MKKTYALASLLLLAPMVAQAQEEGKIESSGEVTVGIRQGDVDSNSSKFNKNRDIDDGFYLDNLEFGIVDPNKGRFLDFQGDNLLKDDQSIRFGFGSYGSWNFVIDRNEIPNNLSNKAQTPYIDKGDGLLTLPSTSPIPNTNLAPSAAQAAAGALRDNDAATATWLSTTLHGTDLGTQRNKTGATLSLTPHQDLKFRLSLSDERKDGSNLTYGPIGDRPPRTLNIQLAEPIDYQTQELKFEAEYNRPTYQALFTYLLSGFENEIDTLRWQNPYVADIDGSGFDIWNNNHRIASFGQRSLAPDNTYQNVSLALGVDLPMASRLNATVAYAVMEQDETLLPYSSTDFGSITAFDSTAQLPRVNADTEIDTTLFNADYSINPIERLNLRAFVRYYELDNKTPQDNWWYVTSDTILGANATSGETTFKNQRVNLAYSYDQMNYGLETSYNLPFWRSTLGLGYEREDIDREFREANTEENILKASLKTRPADWLTLRAKYLYGDRDGGVYNGTVTQQSYWYDAATNTNLDNPALTFSNHPDMRKFDVSDRERDQFDIAATVMPMAGLDLTASYRFKKDDYESGVTPVQPILGTGVADENLFTPGDQLGLLESKSNRIGLDASYVPTDRLMLTAFGSRETIENTQRGMEFNENNKLNPTTRVGNDLGGWDERFAEDSQWMAITDDKTNTIGLGVGYEIIPGTLRLATDYSYSHGKVDIAYSGLGSVATGNAGSTLPASTDQYAFSSPPTVTHKQYNLNATLEYQFMKNLVAGVHYIYDRYKISDWMQEENNPWTESVGSEFLLRDTSSATSNQWGNRLINLGSYLGPSYEAHFGAVTLTYRF
jgi:MtrB/PioB family decaheme-associated outer membrane protein